VDFDDELIPYQLELTKAEIAALLKLCYSLTPDELYAKGDSEEESMNILRVVGSLKVSVLSPPY
jgi:hypothetical protein